MKKLFKLFIVNFESKWSNTISYLKSFIQIEHGHKELNRKDFRVICLMNLFTFISHG